jgi:hypothetical protein
VIARLLLAGLAIVSIVVAIHALRVDHRCAVTRAGASTAPAGRLAAIARETADRCGDPRDPALVALVLLARGHRADATQLARRMTQASPRDYLGWLVVWRLTGDRRALARAHELNPRGTPSPAR